VHGIWVARGEKKGGSVEKSISQLRSPQGLGRGARDLSNLHAISANREVMGNQKRVECFKQRLPCSVDLQREKLPSGVKQKGRRSRWLNERYSHPTVELLSFRDQKRFRKSKSGLRQEHFCSSRLSAIQRGGGCFEKSL
jgi:hypothetical protein